MVSVSGLLGRETRIKIEHWDLRRGSCCPKVVKDVQREMNVYEKLSWATEVNFQQHNTAMVKIKRKKGTGIF